jgi:hypothetical protein
MSNSKPSRSIYTATPIPALKRKITDGQCPDTVLALMQKRGRELGVEVHGLSSPTRINGNGDCSSSSSNNVNSHAVSGNTGRTDAVGQSSSSSAPVVVGGRQLPAGDPVEPVAKKQKIVKHRKLIPNRTSDYSKGKIYKITNIVNEMVFIGCTTRTLKQAFKGKQVKDGGNKSSTSPLIVAIRNEGKECFSISLISLAPSTSKNELEFKKQEVINQYISQGTELYNVNNYTVLPMASGCEGVADIVGCSQWNVVLGYNDDYTKKAIAFKYTEGDAESKRVALAAAIQCRHRYLESINGGDNSTSGGFLPIIEEEEEKKMGEMVDGSNEDYQRAEDEMCRHGTLIFYTQCMDCDDDFNGITWSIDQERHLRNYYIEDGTIEEIQARIHDSNAYDFHSDEESPVAPPNSTDYCEKCNSVEECICQVGEEVYHAIVDRDSFKCPHVTCGDGECRYVLKSSLRENTLDDGNGTTTIKDNPARRSEYHPNALGNLAIPVDDATCKKHEWDHTSYRPYCFNCGISVSVGKGDDTESDEE